MLTLRPYQQEATEAVLSGFGQFKRQLLSCPTGGGKTIIFSALAQQMLPGRTLILAHRSELLSQAQEKLQRSTGIFAQVEKAEHWASLQSDVVVASIQTMQGERLKRWPSDHFSLVVVDEAHHAISESYQRVLSHFSGKVLGVTATPDRGDKRNLGEYFENIAFEIGLFDLINQGYLSRISVQSVPVEVNLNGVRTTAGDFNEADLSEALTPYLRAIARAIKEHAPFRRTLAFLPLCNTSREFVAICNEEGIAAAHVDGESPNRKEILAQFAAGEFDLLSNAMLLTEGYDDPSIDAVVILRPTKSRSLYSQMVGRGTRIAPFKKNLLLLDLLWLHEKLNLIRPAHLIATSDDQAQAITEIAQDKAKYGQQELDLEVLVTEEMLKREDRLRKQLEEKAKKGTKTVDAMEWCLSMGEHSLVDYEPTMKWERNPMTEKQAAILKRAKIDVSTVRGVGHAAQLISAYFKHQDSAPASDKVRWKMKQLGRENWASATAAEGRRFMAELYGKRRAA